MRSRRLTLACLVLLGGSAFGCKSAPACPLQVRTDPAKAISDHTEARRGWRSLKAEARVTQWGRRGRIRGTVLMFLEQPNRVRFDVMTQVGPAAVLTSDGVIFQLSDLREGMFLSGPTCPQNIARLLGIPMNADDVLRILTGDAPTIEASEQSMTCRDGQYVVQLVAPDGTTQELAFSVRDADRGAPPEAQRLMLRRSVERAPEGATRWQATYDDYVEIEGQPFPTYIRFTDEVSGADTTVKVKSITVNPEIPEDVFRQTPVPGMAVEVAVCS